MQSTNLRYEWRSLVALCALLAATALPAQAKSTTWYVGNNGDDGFSPSCGTKAQPCRSVSKAISLAVAGDKILVGPGVYGDLDGSGVFGDAPGEETAEIGSGCECMIKVDKRLTILSRDGALVTILDAAGLTQSVVHIVGPQANGTVFGTPGKGFTILSGIDSGLLTDASSLAVKVEGNFATDNTTGFVISGLGGSGKGNTMIVSDNIATDNDGDGFALDGTSNLMERNRAVYNGGAGIHITGGNGHTVQKNVAMGNEPGFAVTVENALSPFASTSPGFNTNAAIANFAAGVAILELDQGAVHLTKSNLYGNNDDTVNNCGLATDNQNPAAETSNIDFSENYWGAASGVGANPADDGGEAAAACNTASGLGTNAYSVVTPLAKEVKITLKALK